MHRYSRDLELTSANAHFRTSPRKLTASGVLLAVSLHLGLLRTKSAQIEIISEVEFLE